MHSGLRQSNIFKERKEGRRELAPLRELVAVTEGTNNLQTAVLKPIEEHDLIDGQPDAPAK
jgi:hypothetical protein